MVRATLFLPLTRSQNQVLPLTPHPLTYAPLIWNPDLSVARVYESLEEG